jgi:VWFA-related protein
MERKHSGKLLALLLLVLSGLGFADPPLTTADIVRFLRAGISERTVITELQDRGFWAPLDATAEKFLRAEGASDTLVTAIRAAGPQPPAVPTPTPPKPTEEKPAMPGEPSFSTSARTVRIPVSVLDPQGEPVLGLKLPNFKVSENGKPQSVTLFSADRQPMKIALALDVSGSMRDKIDQVEEALKHFIEVLEPKDEIMVITFSRQVNILQDFTSDRERLSSVLTMLQPTGGTALYDAAYEAIRRVAKAPAESKAVVLVSDGVNTTSGITFDTLRTLAQRSEVPVYSLALDSGSDGERSFPRPPSGGGGGPRPPRGGGGGGGGGGRPGGFGFPGGGGGGGGGRGPGGGGGGGGRGFGGGGRPDGFDVKPLQQLADDTGGRVEIITGLHHYTPGEDLPGGGRLKKAVESIALTLRHRYLVGYELQEGRPGWRTLRIEVDQPRDATARARKGYFAEK